MDFNKIVLEEEQKEFFIQIVETIKSIPRSKRTAMLLSNTYDGKKLIIATKDHERHDIKNIVDGDLDILTRNNLLDVSFTPQGSSKYVITPIGFEYYDWLMKEMGKPIERIEKRTLNYFDFEDFRKTYTKAYQKLKKAEEKLWSSDSEESFTTIGHLCREAMQEFADQLYYEVFGEKLQSKKSKTVQRIRKVIQKRNSDVGSTVKSFLEALLPYWGTVSDLVQRQEHGAEKEKGEDINWEDSRRIVFQTVNVMYELHRTLVK